MTKVNKYIICLAMMLYPLALMAQGMVEARIDSIQMMVGEQTGYHVSATVKPGQRVTFRQWKPQQMITPGV